MFIERIFDKVPKCHIL